MDKKRYRYECKSCRSHGRWLRDPNLATVMAERHRDRHEHGHDCDLVDNTGKNHGLAH